MSTTQVGVHPTCFDSGELRTRSISKQEVYQHGFQVFQPQKYKVEYPLRAEEVRHMRRG